MDVTHYRERNKEKSNFFCPVFFHLLLSGNFGDRYFGTDAPSDWCESDEGMEFWGERANHGGAGLLQKHLVTGRRRQLIGAIDVLLNSQLLLYKLLPIHNDIL